MNPALRLASNGGKVLRLLLLFGALLLQLLQVLQMLLLLLLLQPQLLLLPLLLLGQSSHCGFVIINIPLSVRDAGQWPQWLHGSHHT